MTLNLEKTPVMNLNKQNKGADGLKKLLILLSWDIPGEDKDLDLSIMFRPKNKTALPTQSSEVDGNDVLYFGSRKALNGQAQLSADNRTGQDVDTVSTLKELGVPTTVANSLSGQTMDEAALIDLTAIEPTHTEAYISVLDYNGKSFSTAKEITVSFFNADTGEALGKRPWKFNENLQGDHSGFLVGKLTKQATIEGEVVDNYAGDWFVQPLAEPVSDEDKSGRLTFIDANIVINKRGY